MQSRILSILLTLISTIAVSQTGTIRGFLYEKETGEPLIFTNVILKGTTMGASTDVNGYYSISKVPPGNYTLYVSYLGYDTVNVPVSVKANEIITKKIFLTKSAINLKGIDITAERQEEVRTNTNIAFEKVTPKEIKQLPSVGGEPDLAQYLQVLPGVIFTGDQGGQLYIRGGSPIQNKVLLDGMVVYNPFHSIGLFSVFDTEIIRNADVYTGGFGAQYGGRISSVMDIKTRDGNKSRLAGKVGASTFGARALLEGPIFKAKDENSSSSSFILSGKHSYLPQTSKVLYTYADSAGLPFGYTDLYGKASFSSPNGSKVNFFGFNFMDKVNYQAISDLHWNSYGGGSNFILIPGGSPMLVDGNFSYSSYLISLEENERPPRTSSINGFNMALNFTYFDDNNELKYGVEALGFKTDFNFFNALNRKIEQIENTTELGTYVKYKWVVGKAVIEPSFRAHYYASLGNFSPEPRLAFKYNITDWLRFKFAGGYYSQNLISANSDRDVVNLFYGFLSGSDNIPNKFTDKNGNVRDINNKLQRSRHAIVGYEFDITKHLNLNVEGYIKDFTQLTNLNRNKLFEDNADNFDRPDELKKDFIIETGNAHGLDFALKYEFKRAYLWAVYSIGRVNRWDGTRTYFTVFDRRHNVNLVGTYTFGKQLNWEFDARWNYGSGFPFTPTQGFYENQTFADINTNYTTSNGSLGIQYGDINSQRLPSYHRLDASVKRRFELSTNSTLEATFSVTNAYNRENIFYFDRVKYERVNQLPILPSVGVSLTF